MRTSLRIVHNQRLILFISPNISEVSNSRMVRTFRMQLRNGKLIPEYQAVEET
jgi:hypothetical protein